MRWKVHQSLLNLNNHPNQYLQNAWNKYGKENFIFEIIEYINSQDLIEREQYWIDKGCHYNICKTAGSRYGVKHTKESKKKFSGENHPFFGKKLSLEHKEKISKALKGRKHTEEHSQKVSRAQVGEKGNNSKLNWEQIKQIREEYVPVKFGFSKLAKKYNVGVSTIQNIINNTRWYDKDYIPPIKRNNNILNFEKALEIREKYIPRKYTMSKLAKEYNVSTSTIQDIIENKIYKE